MTKFFLEGYSKEKTKRKPIDYKVIAYKKLYKQIQKQHLFIVTHIIRKLKKLSESGSTSSTTKLEAQLQEFKAIHKSQMRCLATYLLKEKFPNLSTTTPQENSRFQALLSESETLKQLQRKTMESQSGKASLEKAIQLHQHISQKKTIKKQKDKLRKTRKLQIKKNPVLAQPSSLKINQTQQAQSKQQSSKIVNEQKINHQNKTKLYNSSVSQINQRTQFKKVGRNKYLSEKRQKQDKYHQKREEYRKPEKDNNSNTNNKLHPSWQAKLQSNKNLFIKPFQGKRTFL